MAFSIKNHLNGDRTIYELSPLIKRYSLIDTGFQKSNAGNFVLKRSLSGSSLRLGSRLKIVVNKDLKTFKMDVTDGHGLRKVNIFNGKHHSDLVQLNYLINNLKLRKILKPISK